jgi:hypothetical protein
LKRKKFRRCLIGSADRWLLIATWERRNRRKSSWGRVIGKSNNLQLFFEWFPIYILNQCPANYTYTNSKYLEKY